MKVIWSTLALSELQGFVADTEIHDPAWADALVTEAVDVEVLLTQHPFAGPVVDELGARKLRLGRLPFIVIYEVGAGQIDILRLHHAKADWRP